MKFLLLSSAVPTEKPTALAFVPVLDPPILLSANQTENGVLLQWSPPEAPAFPLTGYVLQARRDQSQWVILSSSINANQTELLVQGLLRVMIISDLIQLIYYLKINRCDVFFLVTTFCFHVVLMCI